MKQQDLINTCVFEQIQGLLFSDLSGPLRKNVAGLTLKIEGSIFGAKPRMRGPRAGGEPERGGVPPPLGGGGLGGHPQENFENWMMKYAISGYQGTIFAAVFESLVVYLFVWKIIFFLVHD